MEHRARVTGGGQITIPEAVRKALRAQEGDSLVLDVGEGEVRVREDRRPVSYAGYAGARREGEGMSWEEVNAYIRDLRGHDDGRDG